MKSGFLMKCSAGKIDNFVDKVENYFDNEGQFYNAELCR